MNDNMEPSLFKTTDISSFAEHIYRRPSELIGFADLLMRWPSLSFFKVPFFTVMRRIGEDVSLPKYHPHSAVACFADGAYLAGCSCHSAGESEEKPQR